MTIGESDGVASEDKATDWPVADCGLDGMDVDNCGGNVGDDLMIEPPEMELLILCNPARAAEERDGIRLERVNPGAEEDAFSVGTTTAEERSGAAVSGGITRPELAVLEEGFDIETRGACVPSAGRMSGTPDLDIISDTAGCGVVGFKPIKVLIVSSGQPRARNLSAYATRLFGSS